MSVHDDVMATMSALDDWDRRRALLALLNHYYICMEGTRLIIDGEASDLYLVSKSEQSPCENCNEEFVPLGQEFCEHCDDKEETDMSSQLETACDWCGTDTPNGAGHYPDGSDDRVCGQCAEEDN